MLFDSNNIMFWKGTAIEKVRDQWLPEVGGRRWGGMISGAQGIIRAAKLLCTVPLYGWMHATWIHVIIYLFKPTECTLSVNPNVNYGPWMRICHRRFLDCRKCPTLLGDVGNGGGCACVGARGIWELSVPTART